VAQFSLDLIKPGCPVSRGVRDTGLYQPSDRTVVPGRDRNATNGKSPLLENREKWGTPIFTGLSRYTQRAGSGPPAFAFQYFAARAATRVDSLALIGTVLGALASVFAADLIQDVLYEVKPLDGSVFLTVTVVLLLVSTAAALIPAVRAASVDPMRTLREQ